MSKPKDWDIWVENCGYCTICWTMPSHRSGKEPIVMVPYDPGGEDDNIADRVFELPFCKTCLELLLDKIKEFEEKSGRGDVEAYTGVYRNEGTG